MALINAFRTRLAGWAVSRGSPLDIAPVGLHHFRREEPGEKIRLHLRIDPDQHGTLIVNASRVYHLNPSAASMAYLALQKIPSKDAVTILRRSYAASLDKLQADYTQFSEQLELLLHPDEACPVCDLELDTNMPFTVIPGSPYRMDLAITYRCNNNCGHCYNARQRDYPELDTSTWKRILDRLWELRVPHVVFTGGEPTLREDLAELIAHAEHNGQITGINTNGRKLARREYADELVAAGLDHVQITLESHDERTHNLVTGNTLAWEQTVQGLRNVLECPLYVMTNTTLLTYNQRSIAHTLEFLAGLGVPTVGLNALIYSGRGCNAGTGLPESDLYPILELARNHTSRSGQRLIWYTPTQYCHFDPVQMDLGVKGCTAALYNMCIEPDGVVIPCQSYYQPVGDILVDDWDSIWNAPLCLELRERRNLPAGCQNCHYLAEC